MTMPLRFIRNSQPSALAMLAVMVVASSSWSSSVDASIMPTNDDEEFVVIKAGRIITATGDEIDDGMIVIVDGRIRLVGSRVEYPPDAIVIDARDQVVMPGMIHVNTRANLPNYSRSGNNSHRNVADDLRRAELRLDEYLHNGFTAVCLHPPGSGLPGMSVVYRTATGEQRTAVGVRWLPYETQAHDLAESPLDAEDDEVEQVLNAEPYLLVGFRNPGSDKPVLRGALRKAESEIAKVERARKEWEERQRAESQQQQQQQRRQPEGNSGGGGDGATDEPPQEDQQPQQPAAEFRPPAIEADVRRIVALIRKDKTYPLLLHISAASDFLHARDVLGGYDQIAQQYLIQDGFRSDVNYVSEQMGDLGLRVALPPRIRTLPETTTRYNLAAELVHAGCEVSFVPVSDGASNLRQMRAHIAELVRNGLPRDAAIRGITIHPARFLGLESRFGTIERDKEADLIFLDSDPLDPFSKVRRVMIAGRIVWEDQP